MRSLYPVGGTIYILHLLEQPEPFGNGLKRLIGTPGSEWKQPSSQGSAAWGYRCELTNYSTDVLFNLSVRVHATFKTALAAAQTNSYKEGDITLDRSWSFNIPKLDPSPAAPFVFYISNQHVQRFVYVRLADSATSDSVNIRIAQSRDHLIQPTDPRPFS